MMLVERRDLHLPEPGPSPPNGDMSKYCPYHQNNGHTLEECFTVKDRMHNLNDKGKIMWSELKARLKAAQGGQQIMQMHHEPLFNHQVAHVDVEIILSATRSEIASIQHIQTNWELTPPGSGHEELPSEPSNKELPDPRVL